MNHFRRMLWIVPLCLALLLPWVFASAEHRVIRVNAADYPVVENGSYSTMEEVAVYLHTFGNLPQNYLTKREAGALGWNSREGNLGKVAPGCSIGGDHFGNYEGTIQPADGKSRQWTECDIDFDGGFRNGQRIVFSPDGLIFYSDDHYNTFTQVLVEDEGSAQTKGPQPFAIEETGEYTSRDEVAAYLRQFGKLPANYLTKREAEALGWSNKKDNLGHVAPECAIGGDSFGNREGLLPGKKGRTWQECDVNTKDGKRGRERLVFSNDGLIYYTPDSHKSFEPMD